jgi:AcrR family transcriptional regulator
MTKDTDTRSQVRAALIEAASELFLEKDFHGTSLREIAQRADTSSAMINYYFKSKHGLFEAMVKSRYEQLQATFMNDLLGDKPVDHVAIIKKSMKVYQDNPGLAQFLIKTTAIQSGPGSQYLKDVFNFERQFTQQRTEQLKHTGDIRENLNPEVMRILLICVTVFPGYMANGLRELYGTKDYDEFAEDFANVVGKMISKAIYNDHVKFD